MRPKVLFLVNSLSDGGAERVCINMANEFIKEDYDVDFVILGRNQRNQKTYEIDPKITIFDLNINASNKLKKLGQVFLAIPKVNRLLRNTKYEVITSHLPMSNVLTRFSKASKSALYVFHTKIATFEKKHRLLFRPIFHFLFYHRKIVTVSEGVRKEAIEKYHFDPNFVKTIYNPINMEEALEKASVPVSEVSNYIVHVGRFNEAKRQDRMVEIFYQGQFYQNYRLVFCGTGEREEETKKLVQKYHLEKSVLFLGWQENIYRWIKHAELLVCTSDYEAFPMNLIEAVACGAKIVSSNCEYGPSEILLGDYANYLVKPDDIDAYIAKIKEALSHYPQGENPILHRCLPATVIKEYLEFGREESEVK